MDENVQTCRHGVHASRNWFVRLWSFFWCAENYYSSDTFSAHCCFCAEIVSMPRLAMRLKIAGRLLSWPTTFLIAFPTLVNYLKSKQALLSFNADPGSPTSLFVLFAAIATGLLVGQFLIPRLLFAIPLSLAAWENMSLRTNDLGLSAVNNPLSAESLIRRPRELSTLSFSLTALIAVCILHIS